MGIGFKELLIILAIALLIFGAKRLKTIGSDLGGAVKGFKKAMDEGDDKESHQEHIQIVQIAATANFRTDDQPNDEKHDQPQDAEKYQQAHVSPLPRFWCVILRAQKGQGQ